MSERVGLIAGGGRLPLEIARAAQGRHLCAVGFPGITDPDLGACVDDLHWRPLGAVEAVVGTLRDAGVREVVLAGKVDKTDLVRAPERLALDGRARRLLAELGDHSDARLLGLVADVLEQEGLAVLPQAALVPELLPAAGLLGKVEPSAFAARDLLVAWPLARALAATGIGQCLVVKAGAVVAVEALEGTDATIARAVALAGGGVTVVKVAAPEHDPRFDLPTIGPRTIEPLLAAGGGMLAVQADATLVLDRSELIARADRGGIAVLAVGPDGPGSPGGRL